MRQRAVMLAACITVSIVVQCWVVSHAVLPAQDVIRFVSLAEAIDTDGLLPTVQNHAEQPLFPAWLNLVHHYWPGSPNWFRSAQLAAAVPVVLTIVPLFFLLEVLLGRPAACAGCLLFAVMGQVARLGADGLSDSLHLFFFATALMGQVFYWKHYRAGLRPRLAWAAVTGLALALAVLVREEALVLLGLWPVSLLAVQLAQQWRTSWRSHLLSTAIWTGAIALVWVPYLGICQVQGLRQTAAAMLGQEELPLAFLDAEEEEQSAPPATPASATPKAKQKAKPKRSAWRLDDGARMDFAKKEYTISKRFEGSLAAGGKLVEDLLHLFRWSIGIPLLLGISSTRRWPKEPVHRVAVVFIGMYLAAVFLFAVRKGYLSERHLLPVALLGVGWAGQGILSLGSTIANFAKRHQFANFELVRLAQPVMVGLLMLVCLPRTLSPLHSSRTNHLRASRWLSQAPPGAVLDTRGWAGNLAGRTTYDFDHARTAFRDPDLSYVVVERRELEFDSSRSATLLEVLNRGADEVAVFETLDQDREAVLVYRWDRQRFAQANARQLGKRLGN